MTPKEKAKELVDKFYDKIEDMPIQCGMYCLGGSIDRKLLSEQCALIAVDEILKVIEVIPNVRYRYVEEGIWLSIKSEIEAL
jgi:hypothetical protein